MKKLSVIILVLLLLCGCAAKAPDETQPNSTPEADTDTTASTFTPDHESEGSSSENPLVIPAEFPTNGTKLYFVESNNDIDFYYNSSCCQFDIIFISDEKIDQSDVQVELPVDVPFKCYFDMCLLLQAPDAYGSDPDASVSFTYDTYLSYCGFDWAALGQKYQKAQDILTDPQYEEKPVARQEAHQAAYDEYRESYQVLWSDYITLDASRIPQFYPYILSVLIDTPSVEEELSFSTVDVTIKGKTTTVDMGQIRLHPSKAAQSIAGYSEYIGQSFAGGFSPVKEYKYATEFPFDFEAKEDLVLTKFDIPYGGVECTEINISISGGAKTANFIWDGKSAIEVPKGSQVSILATITDHRMLEHGFSFHFWPQMTFEADGMEYQFHCSFWFYDQIDTYEEYAKYFQDIDTDSYYEDFYFPCILGIDPEE